MQVNRRAQRVRLNLVLGAVFRQRVYEDQEISVRRDRAELTKHGGDLTPMECGMHDEVLNHVAKRVRPGLPLKVHVGDYFIGRRRRQSSKEVQLIGVDSFESETQRIGGGICLGIQAGGK